MTVGRLVLDGDHPDAVDAATVSRALVATAERALHAGRVVAAYGPEDDVVADPAVCECHATARIWVDGQEGCWLLPPHRPGMPASPLVPVRLAARVAAAVAIGSPLPAELRIGLPLGVHWWIVSPTAPTDNESRSAVDEHDLVEAVTALGDDEHVELSGGTSRTAALLLGADGTGWTIELLRGPGQVAREHHVTPPGALPAAVRWTVDWVAGVAS